MGIEYTEKASQQNTSKVFNKSVQQCSNGYFNKQSIQKVFPLVCDKPQVLWLHVLEGPKDSMPSSLPTTTPHHTHLNKIVAP